MFNYPFMVRAIVAGIITGALAGFIGVFVVLRKMSFYANAIAHASLSGVALGFLLSVDPFLSAMVVGSLISLGIGYLFHKTSLFMDTAIGVFLPVSMAVGIILLVSQGDTNPNSYHIYLEVYYQSLYQTFYFPLL